MAGAGNDAVPPLADAARQPLPSEQLNTTASDLGFDDILTSTHVSPVIVQQQHAAISKLHERYATCRVQQGSASCAALQCMRNLAQGYCVQGNFSAAEEQLKESLKVLDEQRLQFTNERPAAVAVMRVGIMLELADVTAQLGM